MELLIEVVAVEVAGIAVLKLVALAGLVLL
jgi:hypothetical protein